MISFLPLPRVAMPLSAPSAQSLAPDRMIFPRRLKLRLLLLPLVAALFFAAGWWCAPWFSHSPSLADRARALRFADEAAYHANADKWRDAFISAGRARAANPMLPGMELLVGQMLFNGGYHGAAARYARASQERADSSSASAILLGLEAWSRRGADAASVANAGLVSRLWLEHAAAENLSDGASRFFLAEIDRWAGRPRPEGMLDALHRFQAWESSAILDAKMHLAASEAGSQFTAAHLGRGLRLDASPQTRAVKMLRSRALGGADTTEAKRDLSSAFTPRHLFILGSDPALAGVVTPSEHLTSLGPTPRVFPEE